MARKSKLGGRGWKRSDWREDDGRWRTEIFSKAEGESILGRCIRHSLNYVPSVPATRMPSPARRRARVFARECVCVGAASAPSACGAKKKIYTTFVRLRTRKTGLCGGEIVASARARACVYVRVLSTAWSYRDSIVPANSVVELRLEGFSGSFA